MTKDPRKQSRKQSRNRLVTVRIDEKTLINLESEAQSQKTSKSTVIYQAIRKHVPIV